MKPIIEQIVTHLKTQHEDNILRAVQSVGIKVDRTRLLAALADARRFYAEGYHDAMIAADMVKVVRCEDCIHRTYFDVGEVIGAVGGCRLFGHAMSLNDFCSYGERKENG
jgi:glycyl-tRNA synthetase (class II)